MIISLSQSFGAFRLLPLPKSFGRHRSFRSRNNRNYICGEVEMWKEESLDLVLVPTGLVVMVAYHVWLVYAILHRPKLTVISLNAESRRQWVFSMMTVCFFSLLISTVPIFLRFWGFLVFLILRSKLGFMLWELFGNSCLKRQVYGNRAALFAILGIGVLIEILTALL